MKIDPKAIGVGQYQHDMPQKRLDEALDGVVEDCVNSVGVDLNTASAPLLRTWRASTRPPPKTSWPTARRNGAFTSRAQLKKVPKLGPKAYEQCAGFLRVPEAKNLLDATAVHPGELRRRQGAAGPAAATPRRNRRRALAELSKVQAMGSKAWRRRWASASRR